ncbi:MAG: hypothetical protein IJ714_04980 [Bacteroidales bacterium]|nr:hypothetical protein [Bacteroidales bacterium]
MRTAFPKDKACGTASGTSSAAPWLSGWVGVGKCAVMAAVYLACAWGLTMAGIKLKI